MVRRFVSSLPSVILGIVLSWAPASAAESPETAPEDLIQTLEAIEIASNARSLDQVIGYYHPNFTSGDGYGRAELGQLLAAFWEEYSVLTYDIELTSWEKTAEGYWIETLTYVEGQRQPSSHRNLSLTATVRSQQRLQEGQIVYQEVLAEESRLQSGSRPPDLRVLLPQQVAPGETYEFDAIVTEPLEGRALLGGALDEGVSADDFLKPRPIVLEILPAGGVFKRGLAPEMTDARWISGVIIREDGLVVETRRLRVQNAN